MGGKRFENLWEFNWLSARHRITRYYPLLPVITRYYSLLRFMGEKHLNISGNLIGLARVILLPVITRYYPLLLVITLYGGKTFEYLLGI